MNISTSQKRELLAKLLQQKATKQHFPLSFAQKRLWFLDKLQPGLSVYNVPAALRLTGNLDVTRLEQSLQSILLRHEILRTSFAVINDEPVQNIAVNVKINLPIIDLRELSPENQESQVIQQAKLLTEQPFQLTEPPLLRVALLQLSDTEFVLILVMHHIITDYWSFRVLVRELISLYQGQTLAKLPIQFADFATWQQKWLQSEARQNQLLYWQEQLKNYPRELSLPTDYPRNAIQTFKGARLFFTLSPELSEQLRQLSQQYNATLFMTLLTAFNILLYRYSGQDDILVGSTVTSRDRPEIANLIGLFVNNLIFRTNLSGKPSFIELLNQVKETVLGALSHQDLPFEDLVEQLQPERNLSQNPLFQVMFVLHNTPNKTTNLPGLKIEPLETEHSTSRFDISLDMYETPNGLRGTWEYSTELFEQATIERLIAHFQILLSNIVDNPKQSINEVPLLTVKEQNLLTEWNDTFTDIPELTVYELFSQQVEKTPDKIAVLFGNKSLTYQQLEQEANHLAAYLQNIGVQAETRVGICCDRSLEMVISLLAVHKAGGAYVPLDPGYPQERLQFIINDSQISILLTQTSLLNNLPLIEEIALNKPLKTPLCASAPLREIKIIPLISNTDKTNDLSHPNQLAYLIYTSGSTGTPKGVQILHRSLSNFLTAMSKAPGLTAEDNLLAVTTLAFDIAALEIFLPLIVGACLVLVEREVTLDGERLAQAIAQHQITFMQATPATWRLLLASGWEGKQDLKILCGGEALDNTLAQQLLSCTQEVWNLYGPTETTIWSAAQKLSIDEPVTIGHPIANTQFYVLDEHLQPVPIGVPGELYIGGAGVAKGYWQRPDLTAERFLNQQSTVNSQQSTVNTLYKTGDRVRYLPDGKLEYLGRLDYQVKIRGFRIELGEIEAVLAQHPQISQAVVSVQEDEPGEQRLVAYIVPNSQDVGSNDLQQFLANKLPKYMIPGVFVTLTALPLTPNGKVDRKALPTPNTQSQVNETPRTPTEEVLASIWAMVLGVESVGIEDNFFDLGGHSLLATRLISQVRQVFGVELPLRNLFESPKIADLARVIEHSHHEINPILPIARTGNLPLSFAQQRFWILAQLEPDSPFYNIPLAVQIRGDIHLDSLQRSFTEVVRRQEILRSHFLNVDGQPVLRIADVCDVNIPVIDLQGLPEFEQQQQVQELARTQAQQPFDLAGLLWRVRLVKLGEGNQVLLLTLHHIIADAWSVGLLVREISRAFAERPAGKAQRRREEERIQYVDFAFWQREWLRGRVLEEHLEYWRGQLESAPVMLELPTDYPRPAVQSFRGAVYGFGLSAELTQGLQGLSRRYHSTLFMTLLAVWNVLLYRYSGDDDIVVGSPIANRNRVETEGLIGCFANTLALRTDLSANPSFADLLSRVRATALGAYAHQDLPFEQLVDVLQPVRSLSHSPLFQVMLVLQNLPLPELDMGGIEWQVIEADSGTAKFDLTWFVSETAQGLSCKLEYNTDLFAATTIERLAGHLETLLQAVVLNPEQHINELPLLTTVEQQQLAQWNATQRQYPQQCLHELFEAQVRQTPEKIAVIWGEKQLTYQELNTKANQLACHLQSLGVQPETPVGICVDRSLDMIIGLLAILKADGAYVPLDPTYPEARLAFIIEDSQMQVLLTQQKQLTKLPQLQIPIISLDTPIPSPQSPVPSPQSPTNLAYIIYTSGTTGIPKGVAITHQSPVTLMYWAREIYTRAELTGVLASTSICFDLSIFEIFVPLSWGGCVILADNALQLPELPAAAQVTLINTVPSAARELLRLNGIAATVQTVNLAGEPLPKSLVDELYQQSTIERVYNLYGPSEDTTYSTHALIPRNSQQAPTIGQPIANTQVYILDQNLQPVPVGIPGEIYLSGAGLARGYWKRPKLTDERFIKQSTVNSQQSTVNTLYKTGDRARYLPDGNIEYLGRFDHQVKLRGFRIELGEIEALLHQHPELTQAVAIVRNDTPEHSRLVAYVVPKSHIEAAELRQFLAAKLPAYMLPTAFVILETLPLTANGKVDRFALPIPDLSPVTTTTAPRTPIEQQLINIWTQVLGVESISIHDNFFRLGGDSILAIQAVAKANQQGLALRPRQMFQYQTVAELAAIVDTDTTLSSEQTPITGEVPLTPIQQWFFEQNLVDAHHWNQAILLEVHQSLNPDYLRQALDQLLAHHDGLRSHFQQTPDGWRQFVADINQLHNTQKPNPQPLLYKGRGEIKASLPLGERLGEGFYYFDMSELTNLHPEKVSDTIANIANDLQASFNLETPPLLRLAYFDCGETQNHRLLLIFHHLIIDGISWRVFLEDLQLAYQQLSQGQQIQLPPKTTSYQQWANKLQEHTWSADLQAAFNYWTSPTWQQIPPLPVDYAPGSNTMADVDTYSTFLSVTDTQNLLQEVPHAYRTQINDVLLTALVLAFQTWTGENRLLVELEGHGREDLFPSINLSRTMGWFTSLFPVLLDIYPSADLGISLKAIKEQLRQIPDRGISYGLLRYLASPTIRDTIKAIPLPQVRFNYLGQSDQIFSENSLFTPASESIGHSRSSRGKRNTLIEINSIVTGGKLRCDWTYSKQLHHRQTIATLAENYQQILLSLIQHCLTPEVSGFTPSDFPQMDFSQDELDKLLGEL
ncbi:non-ribosomal peptide synthetase [Anabaena sp. FACHB-709]|uniref:Peptide synthetase n=2 Tax=Nostocaceae TaxID=1162 RepID=A0A1Z4KH21_ANAVA|nr:MULTISPECIES: non-ribosomal peptide synthetase [Nostocaceae]BAY68264.1 peptide synthetase [Trichormus variabilis NIES-23]HBW29995.1 non-ribosomal peptide synthetase [Nostoc sp. UBA8866]MBD2169660.1 non-ribosomal peptide synthetase [Anabaena cylindrica FACHB-318]MBD2261921.1 non-ribosomal peptide synthetase [Anabaena sp. FACHB-709]MBD2271506.1 non-ribosomal peptide synthetase [Nostoc sp. PCC 7120 = FACHB-418]